jgi:hypothetical protein
VALDDARDDVGQVGLGINFIELASFDERGQDRPVCAAAIGAGEEGVLAIEGDRPDGPLDAPTSE